jgi:DNA-binding CsgD family transcriptional regulator
MIGPSAQHQNTAFDNFEMLESLETGNHWHIIGKLGDLEECVISLTVGFRDNDGKQRREQEIVRRFWRQLIQCFNGHSAACCPAAHGEPTAGDWGLTTREQLITELVAEGLTNRQVARRLTITVGTVKKHLTHAMAKTGSTSRTQLAVRWRQRRGSAECVAACDRGGPGPTCRSCPVENGQGHYR